jgi:hypothetical protein
MTSALKERRRSVGRTEKRSTRSLDRFTAARRGANTERNGAVRAMRRSRAVAGHRRFTFPDQASLRSVKATPRRSTILDKALAALTELPRSFPSDKGRWIEAARLLNRAAVVMYRTDTRVGTLALSVSDALMFTDPDALEPQDMAPLLDAVRLLRQPFIEGEAEERVFQSFLDHGWIPTADFVLPEEHA